MAKLNRNPTANLSHFIGAYWRDHLVDDSIPYNPAIQNFNVIIGATLTEAYRRASDEIHPPTDGKKSYFQKQFTAAGILDLDAKGDSKVFNLAREKLNTTVGGYSPLPKVA